MKGHVDIKSAIIGATLAGVLLLAAGMAESRRAAPVIGRFQVACSNTGCYLVDSATGQVWISGSRGFREPKLQDSSETAVATADVSVFMGQWMSDDPNEDDVGLQLEPDGRAIATEGDRRYEGRWRIEGTRIIFSVGDESIVGEVQSDGRLQVWEQGQGSEYMTLKRVRQ